MNQDQQPRPWWKYNWRPLLICVFVSILVITFVVVSYALDWWWTGFPPLGATGDKSAPKTLWDWLGLLIIPAVLGFGAILFNQQARKLELERAEQEKKNDLAIAEDRARDYALQSYFDRMSELLLDKNLGESDEGAVERNVARVRTLTVLRSLDGDRKGQVVRFLYEADLIGRAYEGEEKGLIPPIIKMERANLRACVRNHFRLA